MYATDELADARADYAAAFFVQSVVIQRQTRTANGEGGWNTTYAQFGGPLPGRLVTPQRDREREEGSGMTSVVRFRIELPAVGTVIFGTDRLQIGSTVYQVIGSDAGRPEALCLSVQVDKVGP